MHYFLIAGEASGDLHASHLIYALQRHDPDATFTFLGGDKMEAAAGVPPVVHIRDMAYMGFVDVVRHIGAVSRNLSVAKRALDMGRPDAFIPVDYPSFNLKIASRAHELGIPVYYYISPKVWAWKEGRVPKIKRYVDRMYSILPFEVDYYRSRHDYEVEYVGNPSLAEVDAAMANMEDRASFLSRNGLRDRPIIALLPGSRMGEIRTNLRLMTDVMKCFPQYRGVIAGAPNTPLDVYRQYTGLPVVYDDTLTLLAQSRAALVTSGTATLEAALVGTPQVACYRSNGWRLTYEVMKRVLKIDYVTLPNLIAGRRVIPELLLHLCTPEAIVENLIPLLRDTAERRDMLDGYTDIRRRLAVAGDPAENAAADIVRRLK